MMKNQKERAGKVVGWCVNSLLVICLCLVCAAKQQKSDACENSG